MTYRAHIIETSQGWSNGTVRLLLATAGRNIVALQEDGTWAEQAEGSSSDRSGLILPRASIEPIIEAMETWLGIRTHASTEAAVLREWLAVERERVEKILKLVAP